MSYLRFKREPGEVKTRHDLAASNAKKAVTKVEHSADVILKRPLIPMRGLYLTECQIPL
jgi:hypothetical protein